MYELLSYQNTYRRRTKGGTVFNDLMLVHELFLLKQQSNYRLTTMWSLFLKMSLVLNHIMFLHELFLQTH